MGTQATLMVIYTIQAQPTMYWYLAIWIYYTKVSCSACGHFNVTLNEMLQFDEVVVNGFGSRPEDFNHLGI